MNTIVILALALSLVQGPKTPTLQDLKKDMHLVICPVNEFKEGSAKFERKYPKTLAIQWEHLKNTLPRTDARYLDLCFFQAYYGINYQKNIDNILCIYKIWHNHPEDDKPSNLTPSEEKEYNNACYLMDDISGYFYGLYLKRHDQHALQLLFGLSLDGSPAEGQEGLTCDIWEAYPAEIVKATIGSERLGKHLGEILACSAYDSKKKRNKIVRKLSAFSKSSDAKFAQSARFILKNMPIYPVNQ